MFKSREDRDRINSLASGHEIRMLPLNTRGATNYFISGCGIKRICEYPRRGLGLSKGLDASEGGNTMVGSTRFVPDGPREAVSGQDTARKLMETLPPFSKGDKRGPAIYSTPSGKRITANQEAWCRLVASGWPAVDAYKHCFACTLSKPQTVQKRAWDLAQVNPGTTSRLRELMDARVQGQVHQSDYMRAHVVERLFHESVNAKNDGARIRALELLGNIGTVGLFEPPRSTNGPDLATLDDLREKLRSRLNALLGVGLIDVSETAPIDNKNSYATGAASIDALVIDATKGEVEGGSP